MMIMEVVYSLFTKKEMYVMEHTINGRLTRIECLPKMVRRRKMYENMHLMDGMTFTSRNHIPQLLPYNGTVDFELVAYSDWRKNSGVNQALHFFLDDYRFRNQLWYNLEQTSYSIRKFDYYFTPDYSMWVDVPTEFYNIENLFRTRFAGAYWQQTCGYNVIPTASWGNRDSFQYCFEGLPENSIIAVCGTGHHHCSAAERLFHYALRELEEQKSPTLILVYGEEENVPRLSTPIKFLPSFIKKRFRNG
jgi:hypothetical protein